MEETVLSIMAKGMAELSKGVFKATYLKANEKFVLRPGMMCIIRPSGKNLKLYDETDTQLIDSGMGFTIAFCSDLGEGGATGTAFRAFFAYESESILELAAAKGVMLKEGSYFKNTHESIGIYVYYVEMSNNGAEFAHSHSNKSVLDKIKTTDVSAWDAAKDASHEHINKTALDAVTDDKIELWNGTAETVGDTEDLNTDEKGSLVAAINELCASLESINTNNDSNKFIGFPGLTKPIITLSADSTTPEVSWETTENCWLYMSAYGSATVSIDGVQVFAAQSGYRNRCWLPARKGQIISLNANGVDVKVTIYSMVS